jgi:type II secretory pathway component PulJ
MVEMLLALALLSALIVAITGWTSIAAATGTRAIRPLHREAAALRVLQLIATDIAVGDWDLDDEDEKPRIEISPNKLTIETRTRRSGSVIHAYIYRNEEQELMLIEQHDTETAERLLVDRVEHFDPALDEESGLLTVAISIEDGHEITRSYRTK